MFFLFEGRLKFFVSFPQKQCGKFNTRFTEYFSQPKSAFCSQNILYTFFVGNISPSSSLGSPQHQNINHSGSNFTVQRDNLYISALWSSGQDWKNKCQNATRKAHLNISTLTKNTRYQEAFKTACSDEISRLRS